VNFELVFLWSFISI